MVAGHVRQVDVLYSNNCMGIVGWTQHWSSYMSIIEVGCLNRFGCKTNFFKAFNLLFFINFFYQLIAP